MLSLLADAIVAGLIKGAAAMGQSAVGDVYDAAKARLREMIPALAPEGVTEETRDGSTQLIETALGNLNRDQVRALAASFQLLAQTTEDAKGSAVFDQVTEFEDIEAAKDVVIAVKSRSGGKVDAKRIKSARGKVDIDIEQS